MFKKEEWLTKTFAPHLDFVGSDKKSILLRDNHLDGKIVEIRYMDNRLWCSEDKPSPVCMFFMPWEDQKWLS